MPQVQFVDIPSWGSALGEFGSGLLSEYSEGRKRIQEQDALQNVLNKVKRVREEGGSEEDVLSAIFQEKGLGFDKKKGLSDVFKDVSKRRSDEAAKLKKEKAEQEKLDLANKKYNLDLEKLERKERVEFGKESAPFINAIGDLEEMRRIRKKGNLGLGTSLRELRRGETAKDAAAYRNYARGLITQISNMSIRNQKEFEEFRNDLVEVSQGDEAAFGTIDAMFEKMQRKLKEVRRRYGREEEEEGEVKSKPTLEEIREAIRKKKGQR